MRITHANVINTARAIHRETGEKVTVDSTNCRVAGTRIAYGNTQRELQDNMLSWLDGYRFAQIQAERRASA